jgi:predicted DNA-binding protein
MHSQMKHQLKDLADQKNCTVPDVIRAAIEEYLNSVQLDKVS